MRMCFRFQLLRILTVWLDLLACLLVGGTNFLSIISLIVLRTLLVPAWEEKACLSIVRAWVFKASWPRSTKYIERVKGFHLKFQGVSKVDLASTVKILQILLYLFDKGTLNFGSFYPTALRLVWKTNLIFGEFISDFFFLSLQNNAQRNSYINSMVYVTFSSALFHYINK